MGFKILESDAQIKKMVMAALEHDLNTHVLAAARAAKPRIKDMVANVFRKSDTYLSLLNGDLSGEMGFYKGTSKDRVEAILFKIADLTSIKFYPIKLQRDTFNGGIQIGILKEDFSDLLNMTEAIIDVGRYTLPWLEWLLKRGDEYIFGEYAIIFKNAGRSGMAIMTKTEKAAAMFGVQNIVIKSSDNNNIELITTTVDKNKKDTDNLFSVEVPSEKYSEDIAVAVDKDILKLYNGDYKVIVYPVNAKQSMLYFKNISVNNTLEYIASAKIV